MESIFVSKVMQDLMVMVDKVAGCTAPIFITGESGTGKEILANEIHQKGRKDKPFVAINCAALPKDLIESELFGSTKGSFTGAATDKEGLFVTAGEGTILLDEIAEMPIESQSKLLRVLQERKIRPIGSKTMIDIKCRIIASTNVEPDKAIEKGKLRLDLYHRLKVIYLHLPRLNDRPEDIVPLTKYFLRKYSVVEKLEDVPELSDAAIEHLITYPWPGNIRELENDIHRAVLLCDNGVIEPKNFSTSTINVIAAAPETPPQTLNRIKQMEREIIVEGLVLNNNDKKATAKYLGMGRQTLYNRIKAYGITV